MSKSLIISLLSLSLLPFFRPPSTYSQTPYITPGFVSSTPPATLTPTLSPDPTATPEAQSPIQLDVNNRSTLLAVLALIGVGALVLFLTRPK